VKRPVLNLGYYTGPEGMNKITKIKLIKIDIPLGTRAGHIRNRSQPRFNLGQLVRLYKMCLIG
jgi:hypothetical protein